MKIEMTGKEDRQGPWKIAIAGAPGSGKTIMSSTAPESLFVFFQQEPRIKSVADRSIQHVKIVNDFTKSSYALDQMNALLMHLSLKEHSFETLVIDTGDEFFQQMKAGRTHQNGGEFAIGDWGWIADAYREVMLSIIDLPMNIIVTYHTKTTSNEDHSFKELMLSGQAKDEVAGWFDIVGALDTFSVVDEHGETITKRVFLTSSSRTYPWVKDHSGALPSRFELSVNFTDDIPRLLALASAVTGNASHQLIAEIPDKVEAPKATNADIPSPEELDAKKEDAHEVPTPQPEPQVKELAPIDTPDTQAPQVKSTEKAESNVTVPDEPAPVDGAADGSPQSVGSQVNVESAEQPTSSTEPSPVEASVSDEQAVAAVEEILDATQVMTCAYETVPGSGDECGIDVSEDEALREVTQIRFRQYLCRPHFKLKLDA